MVKAWGEHRWGPGFSSRSTASLSISSEYSRTSTPLPMTLEELRREILTNGAENMDEINFETERVWASLS